MKALITLAAIAAAVLLISLVRLGVRVEYSHGGLTASARVGPVSIPLYLRPKGKPGEKKKQKKAAKAEKKKDGEKEKKGGPLAAVKQYLPLICEAAGRLKRSICIDVFLLDFTAAASDPATAALAFGGTNAAVGMIWPLIAQNFKVKQRRIRTAVDYSSSKPAVYLYVSATLRVGQAVALAIPLAWKFISLSRDKRAEEQAQQPKQREAV